VIDMPTFMDVHHSMTGITEEQLREAHQADLRAEAAEGVHFRHAWADPATGEVFCLSDGPSPEAVMRVHERTGHPADAVYEMRLEI
jgi:hypothetical protein